VEDDWDRFLFDDDECHATTSRRQQQLKEEAEQSLPASEMGGPRSSDRTFTMAGIPEVFSWM
jgi:hypothetical protein